MPIAPMLRAVGMASITSRDITVRCADALCTSTTGVWPLTVMVSSRAPTRSSPFTWAVVSATTSMPSCLVVLNPGSVNVTA